MLKVLEKIVIFSSKRHCQYLTAPLFKISPEIIASDGKNQKHIFVVSNRISFSNFPLELMLLLLIQNIYFNLKRKETFAPFSYLLAPTWHAIINPCIEYSGGIHIASYRSLSISDLKLSSTTHHGQINFAGFQGVSSIALIKQAIAIYK